MEKTLDSAQRWSVDELRKLCRDKDKEILRLILERKDLFETVRHLRTLLGEGILSLKAVDAVLSQMEKSQ